MKPLKLLQTPALIDVSPKTTKYTRYGGDYFLTISWIYKRVTVNF